MVTCIHISGTNLTRGCGVSSSGNRKMKSQQKRVNFWSTKSFDSFYFIFWAFDYWNWNSTIGFNHTWQDTLGSKCNHAWYFCAYKYFDSRVSKCIVKIFYGSRTLRNGLDSFFFNFVYFFCAIKVSNSWH